MNVTSIRLTPLTRRRLHRFRANRRGWWSLWIFVILFITTLLAEVIANDKPFLVYFKGEVYFPIVNTFLSLRPIPKPLLAVTFSRKLTTVILTSAN